MSRLLLLLLPAALLACQRSPSMLDPFEDDALADATLDAPDGSDAPGVVRRGMTWRLTQRFPEHEAVAVGCGGEPGKCDPYVGDTDCDTALPLLCFQPIDAPLPEGLTEPSRYSLWSGGVVQLSRPVSPIDDGLQTVADADAICAAAFGPEWRIAHFHDGWAWNFRAYGLLPGVEPNHDRFWVHIGDQPDGVCWAL